MTRRHIPSLAILVTLLALLGGMLWFVPSALGRETAQVTVKSDEATPNFPDTVDFRLEADVEADTERVVLLYGFKRSDGLIEVTVPGASGRSIRANYQLDAQLNFLPVGVEVRYFWEGYTKDGRVWTTPEKTFVYTDNRFEWQTLSSDDGKINVHWYKGNARFGQAMRDTAVNTVQRLATEIGATIQDPINIYVYATTTDMRAALSANSVEWIGGQARPDLGLIIGSIAPGDLGEVSRLLPHELSHQVLHQATDNPYGGTPLWFDEGLAVYNQEVHEDGLAERLDDAARRDRLIKLRTLAANFPTDTEDALLSYAESYSVISYIIDHYGKEKMAAIVNGMHMGEQTDTLFKRVLDRTVDELDAEWRTTLPQAEERAPRPTAVPERAPDDRFSEPPVEDNNAPSDDTPEPDSTTGATPRPGSTSRPPNRTNPTPTSTSFDPAAVQMMLYSAAGLVCICIMGIVAIVVAVIVVRRMRTPKTQ